jgi:glycosyltransferase involved in cell wall biosynthesis
MRDVPTNPDAIEVSLVMPCLNEARTIGVCLDRAARAIAEHHLRAEIIVVDNGSTDGSADIARAAGARVVPVATRGYGAALRGGIESARGRFVVMADADGSYDWSDIWRFVERLRAGDDLVMGCRLPAGGGRILPGAMPWQNRWLGNPVLSAVGRAFFGAPVTDFHCGMRGFRKSAHDALDLRTTGMEFASEMIIKATLKGQRISELPITLSPDGRGRPPHLNRWRDGWRHLRFMLLFCPRWLFLIPGAVLFVAGLAVGIRLLAGPVWIGSLRFDTNTLLVCSLAMLVGFQLVTFAAFAKVFSVSAGFIPDDTRVIWLLRTASLEAGIIVGGVMVLLGVGLLIWSVEYWRVSGFGQLSYPDGLRIVIPAVTTMALGVQVVIASFFLSVLALPRK